MIMCTLTFIYVLLPLSLAAYYIAPRRMRPALLLLMSLLFYWNQLLLRNLFMMLLCALSDYAASRVMNREGCPDSTRRACVLFSIAKNIIMIAYVGAVVGSSPVNVPLGLNIYALSGIDYILAVYRREAEVESGPRNMLLYCCFFPRLFAGPLLPYNEFRSQLDHIALQPSRLIHGLGRYVQGVVKHGVLGGTIGAVYEALHQFPSTDETVLSTWCMVLALALSVYYSFSGLCDMAQGIGYAFGFGLPNNFYYPYQSYNVADFLERFNMTVNSFIRRTVYSGLREDRGGMLSDCLYILVSGALMGLWFGFEANHMLWGMYLALFIMLERYLYPQLIRSAPTFFARIYALCVVLSSFTVFAADSPSRSLGYLRAMFGFSEIDGVNAKILYLISSNWLILLCCLLFAFSFASRAMQLLRHASPRSQFVLQCTFDASLLLLFTAMSI